MKYKSIIIVILTLFVLISIAAASASDFNDTKIATEELSQGDEIITEDLPLSQENDEEILTEVEKGTFNELQDKIKKAESGGVIKLEKDYACEDGFSSRGILIDKSLTVDGQGHTIDAQKKARIFTVNAKNVIIKNITFINGQAPDGDYGGAIYLSNTAKGSVCDCVFVNNSANYGGAIYLSNTAKGSVCDCVFANNSASSDGGAIYLSNSGSISDCVFANNSASSEGGAIYLFAGGSISDCVFINNFASSKGGAISMKNNVATSVSGCVFVNNSASDNGGAIYLLNQGTVSGCVFVNNSARADGGAIYLLNQGTVSGCVFINNDATNYGGAIYLGNNGISVSDCVFINNVATSYGGNAMWQGSATNCNFINNDVKSSNTDESCKFSASGVLNASDFISYYDSGERLPFSLKNNEGFLVDGVYTTITVKNNNFTGTFHAFSGEGWIIDLMPGTYEATLSIDGCNNIIPPINVKLTVKNPKSTLTLNNIEFDYKSTGSTALSFTGATGVNAKIIDQPKATVNVENNIITVSGLNAGTYDLSVTTIPDDDHSAVTKTVQIKVNMLKTELTAKAITTTYQSSKKLVITLKDSKGNPLKGVKVTVKIKNSKTLTTDENGKVKISTESLAPKKYTAEITFNGNENYEKSTKSVKITVKKAKSKITAKKKTFKAKVKTKKYSITLKNIKGKAIKNAKITLKIKGKTYKVKTNKKGKATFKITKLTPGTYTAVVKFKGNKYFKKSTKKAKITVK